MKLTESATVSVLGIPMFSQDIEQAIDRVLLQLPNLTNQSYCISATGAHGLVYAYENSTFRDTLESFYINLPDGMPGVWIGHLKGSRQMKRCYGPDFFAAMMARTAEMPEVRHFLCGGTDGVAIQLKAACLEKFSNSHIVGVYTPPFLAVEKYDYAGIADQIEKSGANIVWIGLSTPKQEEFAKRLAAELSGCFIMTVGAAFDFHTGRVRQAPKTLQRLGLEWLFRLSMEPKRLYKRYFEIVPKFIYYNFKEVIH